MIGQFPGVPLDDPNLERYRSAHSVDRDLASTILAISIAQDAFAAGHPGDPDAATRALTGPPGAAAVQATMNPFVDEAIGHDETAGQNGAEAVQSAQSAKEAAERWRDLPHEPVQMADGSSRTRGQVQAGHDQRLLAAAQREMRGDFEHLATPPGAAARLLVVPVLSLIEVFLLIWPVTNASWNDVKSVAYVIGLVAMFFFMNEQLPKLAGQAVRDAREARDAARELTAVGVTAARAGDTAGGREITGHADQRFVRAAERKKMICCILVGLAIAVYAAVMFTRVLGLAAPLGSFLFSLLAAALITAFTAGAPVVMARWWARGNALGDQLREYGARTDGSRILAGQLSDLSRADARSSHATAEQARQQLGLGDQVISDGYRVVCVGLQKAAKILGLHTVLMPKAENLFPVDRPIRARAVGNLGRAASILSEAQQILAGRGPFEPAGAVPNPWQIRTDPRRGVPNPTFVEPSQLGPLHTPDTAPGQWWVNRQVLVAAVILLAIAALMATVMLG
ncbi:MAG: hypothetical protein ACLPUO_05265 [Streptosporangiaceae bacterium]|jgi:hypothetical protein